MSTHLDAWRRIAADPADSRPVRISVDRSDVATLIAEIDTQHLPLSKVAWFVEQRLQAAVERAAIAEADADRLAEALEVTATQADPFQQGNVDRLLAAHREAIATRPA